VSQSRSADGCGVTGQGRLKQWREDGLSACINSYCEKLRNGWMVAV